MFDTPRWLEATCSLTVPRIAIIRERADEILDHLKEHYSTYFRTDIGEEMEPQLPRLVFPSRHGNSQIVISQVTLSLQVRFTPDWQVAPLLGRQYMQERSRLLHDIVYLLPRSYVKFVGVGFRIQLPWSGSDEEIIQRMASTYSSNADTHELYDAEIKRVVVVADKYFNNLTVRNYRTFPANLVSTEVLPLPRGNASFRGVELVVDFNDRYSFNERPDYRSTETEIGAVLGGALDGAEAAVRLFVPAS